MAGNLWTVQTVRWIKYSNGSIFKGMDKSTAIVYDCSKVCIRLHIHCMKREKFARYIQLVAIESDPFWTDHDAKMQNYLKTKKKWDNM